MDAEGAEGAGAEVGSPIPFRGVVPRATPWPRAPLLLPEGRTAPEDTGAEDDEEEEEEDAVPLLLSSALAPGVMPVGDPPHATYPARYPFSTDVASG